jgi:site-specific recombinase XerD
LQNAVKLAIRAAGIKKAASCHTFSTASRRIYWKAATIFVQFQELLGHKNVATTMIYTHVLNKPGLHVRSPLDQPASTGNPASK